ncbi:hypothetical protein INF27_00830 [Bifidobacterium saeculare]|nr:hypothetical protein [Bifidobacterium pullorum subsp. saeculare]
MILEEIDRLRAGGAKSDADAETRAVVESLTGVPYDRCWAQSPTPTATADSRPQTKPKAVSNPTRDSDTS